MKTLTVALATRGRPEIMVDTVKHMVHFSELAETTILVLMDEDDPASFEALKKANVGSKVMYSVQPREDTLGGKYNRALNDCPADLYQVAVDYAPILTPGYDKVLLEAAAGFPDGIGCVYGPPANASFPTTQAVTAKWVEASNGTIYPGFFPFWFVDHWLDDVAKMTGRINTVDIMVDCHSRRGPKTLELRDVDFWASFFDAGRLVRRRQADKIIDTLDEPEWRKRMLKTNYHRVEARSLWINHQVRENKAGIEAGRQAEPPDERYARVFNFASKVVPIWCKELEQTLTRINPNEPQQNQMEFTWLLSKIKGAKSILEVGSCHGQSLKLMAAQAAPNAKIRSIDLGTLPGVKPCLSKVMEDLRAGGFDADVRFGNSQDVETVEWAKSSGPFDLVFIDGDHDYDGVKKDYENFGPLGKLVVFHDIAHPGHGVKKLWSEIKGNKQTTEKVFSEMGIGVVFNV